MNYVKNILIVDVDHQSIALLFKRSIMSFPSFSICISYARSMNEAELLSEREKFDIIVLGDALCNVHESANCLISLMKRSISSNTVILIVYEDIYYSLSLYALAIKCGILKKNIKRIDKRLIQMEVKLDAHFNLIPLRYREPEIELEYQ